MYKTFLFLLVCFMLAFSQFQPTEAVITIELPASIEQETAAIDVFIEERDWASQVQMFTGMPLEEVLALNPIAVSQDTIDTSPIVVNYQTSADGKVWQVGAAAKDSTGALLSLISCSGIVQKHNIPEVILNVSVTFE